MKEAIGFLFLVVGAAFVAIALKKVRMAREERDLAHRSSIVKRYQGTRAEAPIRFQADAERMARHGFVPTSQSWVPSLFLVGTNGYLTVTYERRKEASLPAAPDQSVPGQENGPIRA